MHVHFGQDAPSLYPIQRAERPRSISACKSSSRFRSNSVISQTTNDRRSSVGTYFSTTSSTTRRTFISNAGDDLLQRMPLEGVQRFVQAKAVLVKVLWLALFSLTSVILIYELVKCVRDFRDSPVATKYTIRTPESMEFPEVYICNGNSMNRTYVAQHLSVLKGVKNIMQSVVSSRRKREIINKLDFDQDSDIDFASLLDTAGYNHQSLSPLQQDIPSSKHHLQLASELNALLSNSLLLSDDIDSNLADHNRYTRSANSKTKLKADNSAEDAYNFLIEAGFKMDDTFLSCHFGSEQHALDCSKIIRPILDPNNFLCYAVRIPEELRQRKASHGLRLLINSHISLYPTRNETDPGKASGIYVSVSKRFDPTNWLKSVVHPGTLTKIDISATNFQLLNLRSGPLIQPCVEDGPFPYRVFNSSYSRTACQMDCLLDAFYRYCQCLLLVDKSLVRKDILDTSTFCSFNQSRSCLIPNVTKSKKALAEIDQCRKVCHTPCNEWRYKMRSSHSPLYSSRNRQWQIHESIPLKDVIDLRVSFQRIEYAKLVQTPSKTVAQLIADFGGQINLWLGASMVSLVHSLAMIFGFCIYGACSRCFGAD